MFKMIGSHVLETLELNLTVLVRIMFYMSRQLKNIAYTKILLWVVVCEKIVKFKSIVFSIFVVVMSLDKLCNI